MRIIIAFAMVLFALVSHAQVTNGTITSQTGLVLATSGQKFNIPKGVQSFGIDTKFKLWGLNEVVLVVNGQTFIVPAPKHVYKAFKDHGNFRVSAQELGANFGMVAKKTSVAVKKENKKDNPGCTFCGYCYSISATNGQLEYGYSAMCSGTREIIAEVTSFRSVYQIDFTDRSGKVVGTFQSAPIMTKTSKEVKEIRTCM